MLGFLLAKRQNYGGGAGRLAGMAELRAAWSRPQLDQIERLMPVADAEAGQDLRTFFLDGRLPGDRRLTARDPLLSMS